ncbi:hypothetical protein [Comamonas sp. C24C]
MKNPCKECWDPVDRDGEEVCDWCQMTPEQRDSRMARNWWLLAIAVWLLIGAILIAEAA